LKDQNFDNLLFHPKELKVKKKSGPTEEEMIQASLGVYAEDYRAFLLTKTDGSFRVRDELLPKMVPWF
jgi:hypothetical protein